ncbi:MAG: HAD-IA family hydrolase [Microbacteriaceae bacterium]
MPGLIFDCDGVLADTEQHGHLPAFNAAFEKFDLPVRWDVPTYAEKVKIGGGKERLLSILTEEFVSDAGLPLDAEGQRQAVAKWHLAKTAVYTDLIDSGALPARPGIARIVAEAHAAGWKLAVASTSAEPSVRAVLRHAVGDALAAEFRVFAGDVVPRKKPAPDIYTLAASELGLSPDECVVIEDSEIGLRAATSAGLRTVVTVSGFTKEEHFSGASLVVSSLGDPRPGEPSTVLSDPLHLGSVSFVDLELLSTILTTARPHRTEAVAMPELEK